MPPGLTRRRLLQTAAASSLAAPQAAKAQSRRPNILWICTDQQRWDTIHSLGNPYIRTPNLDRLVANGVTFQNAFCQSPICTPSRASFMTGRYSSTVHNTMNGNAMWDGAAPLVTKTLADAGYDCGLAGKFHLSGAQGRIEPRFEDGYRVFDWSHHPKDDWPQGHAYADWLATQGVDYTSTFKKLGYIPPEYHQTKWCADRAIDFLKQDRGDTPWLFSFNCFDPHPPFDPPAEYLKNYPADEMPGPLFRESDLEAQAKLSGLFYNTKVRRPEEFNGKDIQARYWAMIEQIDDHVGRMLQALEESGQAENTLVIFTSDHGESCGDHGLVAKGCRFYENLVHVPLIVSMPGRFDDGRKLDTLVELTDLAPTLLEVAGQPVPRTMQGRSLMPLLEGQTEKHREFVRSEFYRASGGEVQSWGTMVRTERYKQVLYHGHNGLGELFDLETDPNEFNNLWDDPRLTKERHDLMVMNFDSLALATDVGAPRVSRF